MMISEIKLDPSLYCVNRFEPLISQKASSSSNSEPSGSLCSGIACILM